MGNLERKMPPPQSEMQRRAKKAHERLDFYDEFDLHLIHLTHCMSGAQLRPFGEMTASLANQLLIGLAGGEFPIMFDERKFYSLELLQVHALKLITAGDPASDWRARLKIEECEDCRELLHLD